MDKFYAILSESLPSVVIAIIGGIAKEFQAASQSEVELTLRVFLASLAIAAFSGFVMHFLLEEVGVSLNIRIVCVAVSGYCGGKIPDILGREFLKRFKHQVSGSGTDNDSEDGNVV